MSRKLLSEIEHYTCYKRVHTFKFCNQAENVMVLAMEGSRTVDTPKCGQQWCTGHTKMWTAVGHRTHQNVSTV